jgi:hypothetical protein
MREYFIIVKIVAKTRLNYKCYTNGQRMNMYMLTIYIIHSPFGNVMLSCDLRLDIRCNFIYETKAIFVTNVGYNYFIITNWHFFSNVDNTINGPIYYAS